MIASGFPPETENVTKDIQELCDEYYIETRHIEKLNELMKDRRRRDPSSSRGEALFVIGPIQNI